MMKVKHLRKMMLAVALAAAFPQAALACRWYDVACQAREEEQRLEREAEQAFEEAREESERLLREAEAAARRMDLPGIASAEINALWHAAENEFVFLESLARHVESSLVNEAGLLLSDVNGMMSGLSLEQVMPQHVLDHLKTAEVAGSPLNQHIHKAAARARLMPLQDGTFVAVRPPVVSESTMVSSATLGPQQFSRTSQISVGSSNPSVGVGEAGNKYTFSIIPGLTLLLPTQRWVALYDPFFEYAYLVPDLSVSVGFPLMTIAQPLHPMNIIENRASLKLPQSDRFPVRLTLGTIWPIPVPEVLKNSFDANAGVAMKFGVGMTCLNHPIGSCRIDNFSLKGQLKAGIDTLMVAKKVMKDVNYAISYARNTLGWGLENFSEYFAPSVREIIAALEEGGPVMRILDAPASLEGIGEAFMSTTTAIETTGDTTGLIEGVGNLEAAVERAPGLVESVVTEMSNAVESSIGDLTELFPSEEMLGYITNPLASSAQNTAGMIEYTGAPWDEALNAARAGNTAPARNILGEVSKFCEKKGWGDPEVGKTNSVCAVETKLDLSAGITWRNSYTTLPNDEWRSGYDFHGTPDVFSMSFTAREVAGVEFGYRDLLTIKGRMSAIFTESFLYVPLTDLGANSAAASNEDDDD